MKAQDLFLVAIFCLSYTQLVKGQPCPSTTCGNVKIEYPFGMSSDCYHDNDPSFKLICEKEKLFLKNLEVVSISHSSQLRVMIPRSFSCFNSLGNITSWSYFKGPNLGNLTLSENNKLTAIGCNTFAFLTAFGTGRSSSVGCTSLCESTPVENRECNGAGCCQNSVPEASNRFNFSPYTFTYQKTSERTYISTCIYAFLVENGTFEFNGGEDFNNLRNVTHFPVVLDWSIGNQTCEQVGRGICIGENSKCSNSTTKTGYVCVCEDGYHGNPYLGCQDINECTNTDPIRKHNCADSNTCENTPGSFHCNCQSGFNLIATNSTMTCLPKHTPVYVRWTQIFLGTTMGFLVILFAVTCIKQRMKHRKDNELRQKFFEQNGGGMLIQRLSGAGPSNVDVKIFAEEGMKEATNGYDESRILGQGGQGTVYKGILPDNSIVAIKKARLGDSSQVEQFINEVLVLSQINHRNVVKILGCCLETEVPLLVYEFITNGTLFDHLHGSMFDSSLTWEHRLRIAIEVAGTLAYLHSSASIPIIHRDIKTANILLDENLTAKVADFGASRLIPMDKEQLTTMVQGTLGYLDPEYYNTGLLNEKSDVYSFGVVLMELLSGQTALCFERPQTSKHLVSYFASAMKENRLHEIIDGQVMNEDNQREIHEAARVAIECTRLTGEERPQMKEVAAELEALRLTKTKHKWSDQYPEAEDVEHLLGVQILSAQGETSSSRGYDSIKNVAILDIEAGR
ncbi:PREDICTED: wall-associated receptor kinase 4-like [Camelina sativa]|uniref:Wall-associated receptor kinase 4-like n=1 Tax=Camelina sativa TaxID=90675 RepID=A0ABM0VQW6_CAMSA|nr:PREDICTED: wall-associated receptor kinase 4-like [Camelina sativa]